MPDFRYQDINRFSTEDMLKRLETAGGSLTSEEALRRYREFGPKVLAEPDRYSVLRGLTRPQSKRLLNLPLLLRTYLFLGLVEAVVAMGEFFLYLFANGWTGTPLTWSSTICKMISKHLKHGSFIRLLHGAGSA